jgi:hypothetical protein
MERTYPKSNREMNSMRLAVRLVKRKQGREEGNIGDNIAGEGPYEDPGKIIEGIHGDFWDRFKVKVLS